MSDITMHMDKTVENLKHNFSKIRTGRANANILADITVDYYGVATPITQVAAVKAPEAHMLTIEPWDKSLLNAIVHAVNASDLGVTPSSDGTLVRLPFRPRPRNAAASSPKSAVMWPSRRASPSATSVAMPTTSSIATRS